MEGARMFVVRQSIGIEVAHSMDRIAVRDCD